MTRALICGGRDFTDFTALSRHLDALHREHNFTLIIHGAARGADSLAMEWALKNKIKTKSYPANWGKHGRAAGPIRNQQMLDEGKPDIVIAFPGGSGTNDMMARANRSGVKLLSIII